MVVDPAYRLAAALLNHPAPKTLAEVFDDPAADMTHNQAYPIARWFEYHGALQKRGGRYETDHRALIDLLSATRRRHVLPAATHTVQATVDDAHQAFDAEGIDHVFGYVTAANLIVYFEPLDRIQVYVPKGQTAPIRDLFPPGRIPLEVYTVQLKDVPKETTAERGLPRTDLLRTTVDVNAHPHGGAYAALLLDALKEAYA